MINRFSQLVDREAGYTEIGRERCQSFLMVDVLVDSGVAEDLVLIRLPVFLSLHFGFLIHFLLNICLCEQLLDFHVFLHLDAVG